MQHHMQAPRADTIYHMCAAREAGTQFSSMQAQCSDQAWATMDQEREIVTPWQGQGLWPLSGGRQQEVLGAC